ncbi:MAG: hypothetical protein FWD33_01500 [Alphaproteobacteria bacterium]|nr:hypothetical protein [Alphaproteobacteria bacterium]
MPQTAMSSNYIETYDIGGVSYRICQWIEGGIVTNDEVPGAYFAMIAGKENCVPIEAFGNDREACKNLNKFKEFLSRRAH